VYAGCLLQLILYCDDESAASALIDTLRYTSPPSVCCRELVLHYHQRHTPHNGYERARSACALLEVDAASTRAVSEFRRLILNEDTAAHDILRLLPTLKILELASETVEILRDDEEAIHFLALILSRIACGRLRDERPGSIEPESVVSTWWHEREDWWGEACFGLNFVPDSLDAQENLLWLRRGECAFWIVEALLASGHHIAARKAATDLLPLLKLRKVTTMDDLLV